MDIDTAMKNKVPDVEREVTFFDVDDAADREKFKFSYMTKPLHYESNISENIGKGFLYSLEEMQDIPDEVEIFGKQLNYGFGKYFGDDEEEVSRKLQNLMTAQRNLDEIKSKRYEYLSKDDADSLSFAFGSGLANYGIMLFSGLGIGSAAKIAGMGAKAIGTAGSLAVGAVMEGAEQSQGKMPRTKEGELDIAKMTPEWARKTGATTLAYMGVSTLLEKYAGFGRQVKIWEKPVKFNKTILPDTLKAVGRGSLGALSEGTTEGLQALAAMGINLADGTITMADLPAQTQQAFKEFLVGTMVGGTVGTTVAINQRINIKQDLRNMISPVMADENKTEEIVNELFDKGVENFQQIISTELELSSELKNKHGKVWNSMLSAVDKAMQDSGAFQNMTEDERASYANTAAKHYADQALAEAHLRGTTLDAIIRDTDITYDNGIKIARNINLFDALKNPEMIPPQTKLKRTSLNQFIRSKGGIKDVGGDLKSRDAVKEYPGLINKNGIGLDDMAMMAWENGYFPEFSERPTVNDLLDAIDEGLRGNNRYNTEEARDFNDAIADLQEELDRLGIDWKNMTAAEIEQAVNEIPELKSMEREAAFYENFEPDIEREITGMTEDERDAYDERMGMQLYQEGEDRDLVALHSISASNLEKAIDFGGFPVPSIAIVKRGQEFHFDDLPITLVGNKEMIDPYDERNEVYNRDVWTKTFPWVTYKKPTQAKEKSFKNKIEEYYKRTNSENELGSFIYVAQRGNTSSALSQFQSSSGAMLYYLENIKKQKVEFAEKDLASDILERAGIDETLANEIQGLDVDTDRDKITKAFKQFLERKEEKEFSDIKDAEKREKMIKFSRKLANENYFDKEENLYFAKADTIVTASDRYFSSKGKKFIDQYEVRRQLRDMIENDENYREWATEFFEKELVGDKMVRVGNALKPFTLENVVEAMTTGATVASQETPLPAMGKVIAAGAKRLESIRDIKEEGKKLVTLEQSKENMEKVKEALYDFLNMFEKGDDFSINMDRKDAVATALQGVLKNKNITKESLKKAILRQLPSDKSVSDEVLSYGIELAKKIKELARYYFEAKPQRAVGLNEFSAAIIPTSTEFDTIAKKVEDAGLKVVRSDNQTEALEQFDNVFFQRGKNAKGKTTITPDAYLIKLLESADESTLPHELAHYWLTEMWNYTRTGRASESYMKRWQVIADYLGIKPEQTRLTRAQQEKFASSYEAYLTRGELPTPLIGSAFDDYDKWLQRVYSDYNKINYQSGYGKRRVRLTDAAIKFFQSMTTGTLEAPALAPKDTGVEVPQTVSAEEVIEPTNEIVETPTTYDTTRVINITEGEKGVSKVFQREAMKHADRIVDELGVSYNKINLEEQAIKAAEWVQNNLEEARKVIDGAAAPEGIIDTAIFIAYENEMLRIGNNEEYQRALKIHSQVQTQRGQAIAAERISTDDVYNPAYWWKKLQKNKENEVARRLFKGDTEALNKVIETETKSIMKQIAGKPKDEQVEALNKLAEKLQKEYNISELYQMPDDVNERTVKEFIKDTLGVNPDIMAGNEVINKAEQLQKLWENTKDKSGNPSVEAMRAKRELNDLIQAQTPSNALAIWTSIFGRGVMLTSVKSPVLNIISNLEAGFTEGITRRIMYGTTEKAVDKSVKQEFSKYAWEVYKASADIVTTMTDYDDDMRIIGEQILHSQGEGAFRAASRKVEEISFKYLMGAPDAVAKTFAFNDTADLLATKIAREEGAKDVSKRATEIYKDAILIKPQTEQGQKVREQAQSQAHYTTFTNDSWAAKFGLSARNWLNMVGRNKIRLGDLTMKFVKTPANVQMMGLEYGFGLLYTAYNVQEIIKNPQSETSKIAIKAAVRNGLGIALAALLYNMLDPDDYFSEFDTLNPKEKDRMRALGAMPNSIKIGDKWVSLDYFGQLGIPLVGMLEARRNNGLRSYVQSGLTQAAKIPGIKETKQLIDSMSEYARYDLPPEKIAQMMANTVLDQARAMTIPAIVNDIAKMTDDYERDTSGGVMDRAISGIPGLRQTLPERYGIQGAVKTEPALSTLLFGSRVKTAQEDRLVREVEKLAGKDEQPSISDVTKYGDLRLLSPEKKVKVRKEFYKLYNSESKKLIATREYQKKSVDDKKKALNKVRSRVVKSLKEKYSNDIQREKRRR